MKRFALYGRPAIKQAPLQTYCSALIFTPVKSIVRKQFKSRIPRYMQRLPEVQEDWSACLQTLEAHTGEVSSVTFSHDLTRLASVSYDNKVRIWDASRGECLRTLEGHTGWALSVRFSHDSTRLASALNDNIVKI